MNIFWEARPGSPWPRKAPSYTRPDDGFVHQSAGRQSLIDKDIFRTRLLLDSLNALENAQNLEQISELGQAYACNTSAPEHCSPVQDDPTHAGRKAVELYSSIEGNRQNRPPLHKTNSSVIRLQPRVRLYSTVKWFKLSEGF